MAESNADLEARRSRVRVRVTYVAASFIFLGGPLLIVFFIWCGDKDKALGVFNAILPIGSAIIAYWFGTRRPFEAGGALSTQVANPGPDQNGGEENEEARQ